MKRTDYSLNTGHRQSQRIATLVSELLNSISLFQTERESEFNTAFPLILYYTFFRLGISFYPI